jgi:hypothetical protein
MFVTSSHGDVDGSDDSRLKGWSQAFEVISLSHASAPPHPQGERSHSSCASQRNQRRSQFDGSVRLRGRFLPTPKDPRMKRSFRWLSFALAAAGEAAVACGSGDDTASVAPVLPTDAGQMDGTLEGGDAGTADASDAGTVDSGTVTFAIDFTKGPARQFQPGGGPQPVSPLVYGVNVSLEGPAISVDLVEQPTRWGMIRQGGDALTSYNWTNNFNNAGSDYCFFEGPALGSAGAPAGFLAASSDGIPAAQAKGEPTLVTVPIIDFVAGSITNEPTCPTPGPSCNGGGTEPTVRVNSGDITFATADAASPAFVPNVASKPDGGYCTCLPDADCASGCVPAAGPVYEDEFVNFLRKGYADGGAPLFFSLDNEPNYWGGTHPDLWPSTGTLPCQTYTVTYDDIVSRNVQFATAVKNAWAGAKVFGPVVAQDGVVYAHSYTDPHLPTEFLDYYLAQMASASTAAGFPLLDVLDVHYYTNNGNPSAAQCMQSPRLFWDPNYRSLSPAATAKLDFGYTGQNGYFNSAWYPRKYVPRLLAKIAAAFPGANAPGLSISEYNNGCETTIAGGVAQADVLGVFGREGVYAAAVWPLQDLTNNYLLAAFDLYRNFDGSGSTVGDIAVMATTSDSVNTSVYAFSHSDDPNALDVLAVNKATSATTAIMTLAGANTFTTALTYVLQDGIAAVQPGAPVSAVCTSVGCTMSASLPPTSATTFVVRLTH